MTIPVTISSTTAGSRTPGNSPSSNGAAKARDDDDQQGGEGRLSHGLTQSLLGAERYARYSPDELPLRRFVDTARDASDTQHA